MEHRRFIANIANPLDISLLQACATAVLGRHDFHNFYSTGSNVKSTQREILVCQLSEIDPLSAFPTTGIFKLPADISRCYELRIEANGFLKQMIRHLVSAFWMVASSKLSLLEFNTLLDGPKAEKRRWKVASPTGLHLYKINYLA